MSELKPKEVGIGTIRDVQRERIAGRRGDKPGELKSQIASVFLQRTGASGILWKKPNVLSEGTTRKSITRC